MSELRAALEAALGPIYRIEREVRPVGTCRLFVAVGAPAAPEVLVKVLPAELSLAVDARVFEREVVLLADRLGHASIVPPRGAGRAGAVVYHTRSFVEGTTLRAWLANHGELPLRRAVEILRDVLTALAHAHHATIAHGDLKPENVLLAGGRARVADAGVVDALERALSGGASPPGAVRAALCAPAYLAPERRDDGAPGGPRDDMFAVGVLLHEMLTGRPPAGGPHGLEEGRALPPWLATLARRVAPPALPRSSRGWAPPPRPSWSPITSAPPTPGTYATPGAGCRTSTGVRLKTGAPAGSTLPPTRLRTRASRGWTTRAPPWSWVAPATRWCGGWGPRRGARSRIRSGQRTSASSGSL